MTTGWTAFMTVSAAGLFGVSTLLHVADGRDVTLSKQTLRILGFFLGVIAGGLVAFIYTTWK